MSFEVDRGTDELLHSESSKLRNWWQDDLFLLHTNKEQAQQKRQRTVFICILVTTLLGLLFSIAAVATAAAGARAVSSLQGSTAAQQHASWPQIRRIAFSSCTSYDLRPQPIWTEGVIPSQPDAWVWLGDITYMDDPLLDCNQVPTFPECNCTADFMRRAPFQCFAGSAEHARTRMQHQLSIPQYQAFLSYMCPGYQQAGVFPPLGTNPTMCPRPIFGTYDDHDSGWNNGNSRNPSKYEIKNIYLDGIGEAQDSPRRSNANGLQASYLLPGPGSIAGSPASSAAAAAAGSSRASGSSGTGLQLRDEIQLVLLDERWFRETLPCSARERWCRGVLRNASSTGPLKPSAGDVAFCHDFLVDGGLGQGGSCCKKDDEWGTWCSQRGNKDHPSWHELCDPTCESFAQRLLVLDDDNTTVLPLSGSLWTSRQADLSSRLLEATSSPTCEVLGLQQRQWLQQQMRDSRAALNIIASGSVLAGSVGWKEADGSECSGDDLSCWPRAQVNLLHTVANTSGCTIVIVGDFHYSDLKVIQPGRDTGYASRLQTEWLRKPIFQVMGSGMTYSTAEHQGPKMPCAGSFREDLAGLRPLGRCSYVPDPAFSMIEVDWQSRTVSLSVRNHTTGGVAYGIDGSRQLLNFSLDTCELV